MADFAPKKKKDSRRVRVRVSTKASLDLLRLERSSVAAVDSGGRLLEF